MRVLRGGSWGKDPKFGRAAVRSKFGTKLPGFQLRVPSGEDVAVVGGGCLLHGKWQLSY